MALPDPEEVRMSLGDHLDELRYRLLMGFAGPLVIAIVALVFGQYILMWLTQPAFVALRSLNQPPQMLNTNAVSVFALYMKVSFVTGLVFGLPWLFYQLWMFIAPGLYKHERKLVYRLIPGSVALSVLGVLFMYYIMLPLMLYFLLSFTVSMPTPNLDPTWLQDLLFEEGKATAATPDISPLQLPIVTADPTETAPGHAWVKMPESELRVDIGDVVLSARLSSSSAIAPWLEIGQYISLVAMLAIAVALAFQLPLVMLTLGWVGIFDAAQFAAVRKYALLGCVVVSAVLTPSGDLLSLSLLAVPLYGLYELGILLVRWTAGNREGPEAEA